MPAPLKFDWERVNWRMRADDLALLEVLYPGRVNEVARDVIHAYCEHLKRQRPEAQGVVCGHHQLARK